MSAKKMLSILGAMSLVWSSASAAFLVFGNRLDGEIYRADLDGSNQQLIISSGINQPREIQYNSSNGRFYWNDRTIIRHANVDGSDVQTLGNSFGDGFGLALDLTNSNVYFNENVANSSMRRIPIGGGSEDNLLNQASENYVDIAVDPANNFMYWTSASLLGGSDVIYRAELDGSNQTTLLSGLANPWGIAIDTTNSHIYFSERDSGNRIRRVDTDGSNLTTILTGLDLPEGIALDIPNNRMYYTEDTSGVAGFTISSSTLTGTGVTLLNTIGSGDSHGIAIVPEPSTYALILSSIAVLISFLWRRKR